MQQPALLAGHVTLPSNQTLNVGVAHVMRKPSTNNNSSSKKNKQHQMSGRYLKSQIITDLYKSSYWKLTIVTKGHISFNLEVQHLLVLPSIATHSLISVFP